MLGDWLYDRPRDVVFELGADDGPVAAPGRAGHDVRLHPARRDASTTLDLAAQVLSDRRDLTQKATGWMLARGRQRVDGALLLGSSTGTPADGRHRARLRHRTTRPGHPRALPAILRGNHARSK
ncbi:hypothetical protein GS425_03665 [Rhodococcus hoagii]|nr:hypothetical protein [Prescottella equi]